MVVVVNVDCHNRRFFFLIIIIPFPESGAAVKLVGASDDDFFFFFFLIPMPPLLLLFPLLPLVGANVDVPMSVFAVGAVVFFFCFFFMRMPPLALLLLPPPLVGASVVGLLLPLLSSGVHSCSVGVLVGTDVFVFIMPIIMASLRFCCCC